MSELLEKVLRLFIGTLSVTNQYIMFIWILVAGASVVGFVYAIFLVNRSHNHTYPVKLLTSFLLMLGAVGFTVYLSMLSSGYQSEAFEEIYPYDIDLTRISSDTVSLSWSTKVPTRGYLTYSMSNEVNQLAISDKGFSLSTHHSVILRNIKLNILYRYSIVTNGKEFSVINAKHLEFIIR